MQGRSIDVDAENKLVDTAGEGEGGMHWESSTDIHTLLCVKRRASGKLRHREPSLVLCDDLEGAVGPVSEREVQAGEGICIHVLIHIVQQKLAQL